MSSRRNGLLKSMLLIVGLLASCVQGADAKSPAKRPEGAACGADKLTTYIGRPVDALRQLNPPNANFVCKGCVTTSEFRSSRLTVIYSRRNGLILDMYCG